MEFYLGLLTYGCESCVCLGTAIWFGLPYGSVFQLRIISNCFSSQEEEDDDGGGGMTKEDAVKERGKTMI